MSVDPIKEALRMMPYGFYGITSTDGAEVNAMVANWVMQASFEPRTLVLGLQRTSHTYGLIAKGKVFAVNIFRVEDAEALKPFTKGRSKNPDKMKDAAYAPAPETGCPVLQGAAAYIECRVKDIVDIGADHDLVVGEVAGAGVMKPGDAAVTLTLPDLGWSYAG